MLQHLLLAAALQGGGATADTITPPPVTREFRGLWVATVNNLDWPSRPDLTTDEQQQELLAILDRAASLQMNAIIFQVRPEADALYASRYEPWSRYLAGRQGQAPNPRWDPLEFAVTEAHRRGLELHAWFNPYRAAFHRDSTTARTHIARQRPDLVVPYAQYLWMNPGIPEVRRRTIRAVLDVVRRYDVDGVHIDDYFYPYPETNSSREKIEFPDARTYAAYRRGGGTLGRDDWRRRNVNTLVRELYAAIKDEKPWVKFGISPFGIWRPGVPPTTWSGVDQYAELYADARKWLRDGTLDYMAPQLYWPILPPEQSYPVLLGWWVDENVKQRHMWPGLALYKVASTGPRRMTAIDIVQEIRITRDMPGATGHIHFNAKVLLQDPDSVVERLAAAYAEPALVPASPWLDPVPPSRPTVRLADDSASGQTTIQFAPREGQRVWRWVVQTRAARGRLWKTMLVPGSARALILDADAATSDAIAVSAVDRTGNVGAAAIVRGPVKSGE